MLIPAKPNHLIPCGTRSSHGEEKLEEWTSVPLRVRRDRPAMATHEQTVL